MKHKIFDCLIVGGGASGLLAAVLLSQQNPGRKIGLVERLPQIGRKLKATGNGRCNLSAVEVSQANYHSQSPDAAWAVLEAYPARQCQHILQNLGIPLRVLGDGIYPLSLRAESVLDVLTKHLELGGVELMTNTACLDFSQEGQMTRVLVKSPYQAEEILLTRALLLAGGGKTQPALGSDGSILSLLETKGLHITKLFPALTTFALQDYPASLAGVRVRSTLTVVDPAKRLVLGVEAGEILFNKSGLSGIPTMQLSAAVALHLSGVGQSQLQEFQFRGQLSETAAETLGEERTSAWRQKAASRSLRATEGFPIATEGQVRVTACLDLLPWLKEEDTESFWQTLVTQLGGDRKTALRALFPRALADYLEKKFSGIPEGLPQSLRAFTCPIAAVHTWDQAQVTGGGLGFDEVLEGTLGLKRFPGVYVAGEILDVYGDCGGYNLQWAWSSAAKAASEITEFLAKGGTYGSAG